MARLLVRKVFRDRSGRRFDLHLVNIGRASACAASWRIERAGRGAPIVTIVLRDLPSAVPPGADLIIATADSDGAPQEHVDLIIRWVQPSGAVDEAQYRLN